MSTERIPSPQRREQLAQAALAVIAERGLRGLSVAAVARRVGLVPSALYRHYRSKDALLDAAVETIRGRLMENIHFAERSGRPAIPALQQIILRHAALIRENPALPRILFSDEIHIDAPERRVLIRTAMGEYIESLADFIHRGQAAGQIRAGLDPRDTAFLCLGVMQAPTLLWVVSGGAYDSAAQIKRNWRVFSRLVLLPHPDAGAESPAEEGGDA